MRRLARLLLVAFVLAAPTTLDARAARAADVPAGTDLSWIRVASYFGKRYGPSAIVFFTELIEHMSGSGSPPPPPPEPEVDPPVQDPDYTP